MKIGHTGDPRTRLSTYLTGCPPDAEKKYDLRFERLWETDAKDDDESRRYEKIVHNFFLQYRMMRSEPGDSEWFHFPQDPLLEIDSFMDKQTWAKRTESLPPRLSPSKFLKTQILANTEFIQKDEKRLSVLNSIQEPVIEALKSFLSDKERIAGTIIAPCGSGKTVMPSKAIKSLQLTRILICCPTEIIQKQWKDAMIQFGNFEKKDILFVGDLGTTEEHEIKLKMTNDKFCIISTYMSSHILLGIDLSQIQLFISDEAHHQAGIVSTPSDSEIDSESGREGRTRRLLQKISKEKMKRLFLTFTPRNVKHDRLECFSMTDNVVFGEEIARLDLRVLIDKGVLPDYRIWTLKDSSFKNTGIIGKAQCLIEAWNATEIEHGIQRFRINHLIVFTKTIKDAKLLQKLLREKLTVTLIIRSQEGNLQDSIEKFSSSERAILIDCHRLSEGVDIPKADSVAILYPKQSKEQMIQMLLRPGRWFINKELFHILILVVDDEDLSGMGEVLIALAENDPYIRDEVEKKSYGSGYSSKTTTYPASCQNNEPGRIIIEEFRSDQARECFTIVQQIPQRMFKVKDKKEQFVDLQRINHKMNITSRMNYEKSKETHPFFIENPEEYFQTDWTNWYDFFGIDCSKFPKTKDEWKKIVQEMGITSLDDYIIKCTHDLPVEPTLFFPNFFNFHAELGIEDDICEFMT